MRNPNLDSDAIASGGLVLFHDRVADEAAIGEKFRALAGELNERQRRMWAASEARAAGRGGIAATARATGMSVPTIRKGIAELRSGERLDPGRVRRLGGGRNALTEVDPTLLEDLERLVDADSRGDPESLLRWTSKSVRHLGEGLRELGHQVHFTKVAQLLRGLGYSLQANVKTREGKQHPDRDAQFRHINVVARPMIDQGQPVIRVDTKKKELVGDFKNAGRVGRLAKRCAVSLSRKRSTIGHHPLLGGGQRVPRRGPAVGRRPVCAPGRRLVVPGAGVDRWWFD